MLQESEVWDNHSETVSSGHEKITAPINSAAVFAFTWPTHKASHQSSFGMEAWKPLVLTIDGWRLSGKRVADLLTAFINAVAYGDLTT